MKQWWALFRIIWFSAITIGFLFISPVARDVFILGVAILFAIDGMEDIERGGWPWRPKRVEEDEDEGEE